MSQGSITKESRKLKKKYPGQRRKHKPGRRKRQDRNNKILRSHRYE